MNSRGSAGTPGAAALVARPHVALRRPGGPVVVAALRGLDGLGRAGAGPHEVGLDVHVSRRWVTVTVTDDGAGFDPGVLTGPRPGVPGAHGLQMVAALSDMRGIDSRDPFRIWFGRLL